MPLQTSIPDPLLLVALIAAIAILPFFALLVTSYTKIVVVLGLLRQALGVQQVPPNMVLNGIALILTVYVMAPLGTQAITAIESKLHGPAQQRTFADVNVILQSVSSPLRGFLYKHTDERNRKFFTQSAAKLWPTDEAAKVKEDDLLVLIPGFTVSELTKAFQIGFVIYLAFVVVDLVIANVLLALGMSMVSPTVISVPFKLLLFVVLNGWERLAQGLVLSYQ
jgi:type III secretion protein R